MATPAIPLIVQSGSRGVDLAPRRKRDKIVVHSTSKSPPPLDPSPENYELEDLLKPADNEWLKEGRSQPEPGLVVDDFLQGLPDTEFNRIYPPDPWGEEASENARVWKLYRDQFSAADKGMLETWSKTVDVLLIFAGLFSAVLTAFLLEAYKNLQPDHVQYIAAFLYASAANNLTAGTLFSHGVLLSPDKMTQTTSAQRLTNGLWFMSLFFSLAVALLGILLKQWLDEYNAHISASAPSLKYWARRHQLYSAGMRKWGLPSIISCLPTLLHFSVFLFFIGLVLFLQPLDGAIAYTLLGFVVITFVFYVLSVLMPAWHVDCPSYTPLLRQLPGLWPVFLRPIRYFSSSRPIQYFISKLRKHLHVIPPSMMIFGLRYMRILVAIRAATKATPSVANTPITLEERRIRARGDELDGLALAALLTQTNDPDVLAVGTEAFGAFNRVAARVACTFLSWGRVLYGPLDMKRPPSGSDTAHFARRLRAYYQEADRGCAVSQSPEAGNILDLSPALGASGPLLHLLLGDRPESDRSLARCVSKLFTLAQPGLTSAVCPRSICLLFLSSFHRVPECTLSLPELRSLVLLLFCAGNFSHDVPNDDTELNLALLGLGDLLTAADKKDTTSHTKDPELRRGFNTLCKLLSDDRQYSLLPGTAEIVAEHFELLAQRLVTPEKIPWPELHTLPALARSRFFAEHISTAPVGKWLAVPMLMYNVDLSGSNRAQVDQFWVCTAAMGKCGHYLSLERLAEDCFLAPGARRVGILSFQSFLFAGDGYKSAGFLRAYLTGESAVGTWPHYLRGASRYDRGTVLPNAIAAYIIYRAQGGIPSDDLVRGFFAGEFVADTFRFLLRDMQDHRASDRGWCMSAISLARKCLQLSQESWLEVYSKLESEIPQNEDSEQRAFIAARLAELQEILSGNGRLCGECGRASCWCTAEMQVPTDRGRSAMQGIRRWLPWKAAPRSVHTAAGVNV